MAKLQLKGGSPAATSRLEFTVPRAGRTTLVVYDVQGRAVRKLLDQDAAAGTFVANWDGHTGEGVRAARGLYFARLVTGSQTVEKKIILE